MQCKNILSAFLLLMICNQLNADTVIMKAGQKIEGEFKNGDASIIVMDVGGQLMKIETSKIKSINFGSYDGVSISNSLLGDAMVALNTLRSIATANPSYRDFAPKVMDAKIVIDRYLNSHIMSETSIRNGVADALELYLFASTAWNAKITSNIEVLKGLGMDDALSKCPNALAGAIALNSKDNRNSAAFGLAVAFQLSHILNQANDKTLEVERLIAAQK